MDEDQEAEEEERGRVAPNMGAGGSHPQATSDPGKEKKETRVLSWADCNDEEVAENEEEVEQEKETRQEEELTGEKPPGLEANEESEHEVKEDEEQKRAQEAPEEERSAQEAREEQERAQEAPEQRKAQEEREKEAKAQEERERLAREAKAQEEREREVSTHEERKRAEAQEGHEGKEVLTTQKECVEEKKETNSMQEEHDVSNRHMTWWRNAWWIRVDSGPHMRTARGRRRVWRAARRAAEQARDNDGVGETQSFAEEAEGETGGRKRWEQGRTKREESNTLHVVFHFENATTPTAAAAAAVTAAMRLQ